jgi:Flp pilus assembly pilin Flp
MNVLLGFWRDERASAAIEYGLIVMGISIAIIGWASGRN